MIHASSGRDVCFIKIKTEGFRRFQLQSPPEKKIEYGYQFSLDKKYFTIYDCDRPVQDEEKKPASNGSKFDLSPNGAGKQCKRFRYDFQGAKLILSNGQLKPGTALIADDVVDDTWIVTTTRLSINNLDPNQGKNIAFKLEEKTALYMPSIIRISDSIKRELDVFIRQDEHLNIKVPELTKFADE